MRTWLTSGGGTRPRCEQSLHVYLEHLASPSSTLPTLIRLLAAMAGRPDRAALDTIRGFLRAIDERYGGATGWAGSNGIDDAVLDQLRSGLLDARPR